MNSRLKHWLVVSSGILGLVLPTYFAWVVYQKQIPQNIATWGMVFVLDLLGTILVFKGKNEEPYLQLGWMIAALCIFVSVLVTGGENRWGWTETVSVILCGIAIYLWITKGPLVALWAYMAAMYISFVPQAVDYWNNPQPWTLWLWELTIVSCLLAILGAKRRDFANTFVPWAAIPLNAALIVLCII